MRSCSGVRQLLAGRKSFPVRLGETVRQAVWLWPVVIIDAVMSKERQPFPFNLSHIPCLACPQKAYNPLPLLPRSLLPCAFLVSAELTRPAIRPSVCLSLLQSFVRFALAHRATSHVRIDPHRSPSSRAGADLSSRTPQSRAARDSPHCLREALLPLSASVSLPPRRSQQHPMLRAALPSVRFEFDTPRHVTAPSASSCTPARPNHPSRTP
eukprot:COSAG06_NODE_12318_length_1396_cov_0.711642_3_plen_210_part_01